MKRSAAVIALAVTFAGCGGKAKEITNATNGLAALANSAGAMAASAEESQKFLADRQAKGDTIAIAEYNKDSRDAKIIVGTRYRYFITVEATSQKGDEAKLVSDIAMDIAKKLSAK